MKPRLAVVRQGQVAEAGEPHAGIIDVLLDVDEPRMLRMVAAVLRSAAGSEGHPLDSAQLQPRVTASHPAEPVNAST